MNQFNQLCNELERRMDPKTKFNELARYLFENCFLWIAEQKFYFTELEFYYESAIHPDKFCHHAKEQSSRGQIYWHPSGMDITIGNGDNIYGGILIRGIETEDGKTVFGPQRLISTVFFPIMGIPNAVYNYRRVPRGMRLITSQSPELNQKKSILCFKTGLSMRPAGQILQSERIGLGKGENFSADELTQRENFAHYPYRYYIATNTSL